MLVAVLIRPGGGDVHGEDVLYVFRQPGRAVADLLIDREIGVDLALQGLPALPERPDHGKQHSGAGLVVDKAGLDIAV